MIRNFVDGDIATRDTHFVCGKEQTRLNIISRLRLFLGEYFLDATLGTPWFQSILGKNPQSIAELNIKSVILNTPGVMALSEFEYRFDAGNRKIMIAATVVDINNQQFAFLFDEELV